MRRSTPIAAVLALCCCLQPLAARAQAPADQQPASDVDPKRRAKELFQLAETEYRLGRFQAALADYQAALKLRHHTAIIFNIAQCYRQLKNYERALFFYKLFLADWERLNPGTTPPNESEVKAHISNLEAAVRAAEQRAREAAVRTGGDLVLKGVPAGAQVFVDGVLRGAGPILAPIGVPPGRHLLRVEKPGFEPWPGEVAVALDKPVIVEVQLRKLVSIGIDSRPDGAAITVDGEERGWTPVRLTLAAQRPHSVVLRKPGYRPLEQTMTIEPQETATASYALEPTRDVAGTRNEWFSLDSGLAVGMGGNQGFAAGGGAINIVTLKWKYVHWTNFTIGGGGGAGRWYTHMETRLAYPLRFGRRYQHQLRAGMGFGILTVSLDDVTRGQLDLAWVQEKSTSGGDHGGGPFVTLALSPAVEYSYQTTGRTVLGGGFRALVPITRSFAQGKDACPAVGLFTVHVGWASQL